MNRMVFPGKCITGVVHSPAHFPRRYIIFIYTHCRQLNCYLSRARSLSTHPASTLTIGGGVGGEHRARSDTKIFDLSAPSPRTLYILISLSLAFSLVNNVQTLSITYHRCLFCLPFLFLFRRLCSAHTLSSVKLSISVRAATTHSTLHGVFQSLFFANYN
jgi:hypothetical protein